MATRIVADSSCDVHRMPGIDFVSVPLIISTDEASFTDDQHLDLDHMLTYLASYKGRSFTACPSIEQWMSVYEGADTVYVVTMSSNISGTYNAAQMAAQMVISEHPEVRIHVFDTKSAGPHVRLVVDHILSLVNQSLPFDEVCRRTEDYMAHTRVFFALKSFHNFVQNGRVSKTVAAFGSALGIHIMATASREGRIEIIRKCRGDAGTHKGFLEEMRKAGYSGGACYIAHCQNPSGAQKLADELRVSYPGARVMVYETHGLCSYYAEAGGILLSCECDLVYK